MESMKAIICAAGQGRRLRPYTNNISKCLLKIGRKRILEYLLDNISECGIKEAVIVIGYKAEEFMKIVGTKHKNCKIKYCINKDYEKNDNMYSLWMAKDEIEDGFIFFNADVMFNVGILRKLIDNPYPNCIVVDDNSKLEDSAMKVKILDNKLVEISRNLKDGNARAIGIYKYSPAGAKIYFGEIKKIMSKNFGRITIGAPSGQIEKAVDLFMKRSKIYAVKTGNFVWQEIDDAEDLKKASKNLYLILKK